MLDKMIWFSWLRDIMAACINGEIKARLPLQTEKEKPLSIVLNGPSVNRTIKYLNPNETEIMMVNNAPLTSLYKELNPRYVCFCDAQFTKKTGRNLRLREELLNSWEKVIIFLPHYLRKNIYVNGKLNVNYVFSPNGLGKYDVFTHKLMEKNLMTPTYNNVAIMCIYVGIQLGYKKIYLYGADENFMKDIKVNENNKVMRLANHYYGSKNICENAMHGFDMEMMTYMMYMIFRGLKQLKQYAVKEHVNIINMSDDSWIDCFKRFKPTV